MNQLTSSIIICTRNRPVDLARALQSIAAQTESPTELIIVDSSDVPVNQHHEIATLLAPTYFKATRILFLHTHPGLPRQRNIGIAHATAQIIYFLDDDVQLDANYLFQMNQAFEKNPSYVGGMGAVQNIAHADFYSLNRVLRTIFLLQRDYAHGRFTFSGMPTHAYGTTEFRTVEVLGGCCMAYRSWIFKQHMFDEALGGYAYMEDCDFSRRVSFHAPLFFNPAAQLLHFASPISRDNRRRNRAMYIYNYSYLFFKNEYPHNRLKIICYWWTIIGLFIIALLSRDGQGIKGYWSGLKEYYS